MVATTVIPQPAPNISDDTRTRAGLVATANMTTPTACSAILNANMWRDENRSQSGPASPLNASDTNAMKLSPKAPTAGDRPRSFKWLTAMECTVVTQARLNVMAAAMIRNRGRPIATLQDGIAPSTSFASSGPRELSVLASPPDTSRRSVMNAPPTRMRTPQMTASSIQLKRQEPIGHIGDRGCIP